MTNLEIGLMVTVSGLLCMLVPALILLSFFGNFAKDFVTTIHDFARNR